MAAPAYRHIQDQNFNILYNGTATGGKTDAAKPAKKGGLGGGRKALNDISNSRQPSVLQSTKKDNLKNVIPIEKDPFAGKGKLSKAPEKGKTGGRKALSDLTNSVKPSSQQVSKTGLKLNAVAENVPISVMEGFLHDHQQCIKAQMKSVDMDFFLKSVGLNNDIPRCLSATRTLQSSPKKAESNAKILDKDEIPEQPFGDKAPLCMKSELSSDFSSICRSPKSPRPPYMNWEDNNFGDMKVIESP